MFFTTFHSKSSLLSTSSHACLNFRFLLCEHVIYLLQSVSVFVILQEVESIMDIDSDVEQVAVSEGV